MTVATNFIIVTINLNNTFPCRKWNSVHLNYIFYRYQKHVSDYTFPVPTAFLNR